MREMRRVLIAGITALIMIECLYMPVIASEREEKIGIENIELVTVADDSFSLTFSTTAEAIAALEYGLSPEKLSYRLTEESPSEYHYIEVGGLEDNTTYYYTIIIGDESTPIEEVKTFEAPGEYLFSFATLNDNHYTDLTFGLPISPDGRMWSKEDCDGLHEACVEDINARSVSFTIIKGDLTMWSLPSEFEGAKEYFDMLNAPHYAIPGNHDKLFPWAFSGYYSSDLYYSFDYMGYHFICLDSAKPDWGTVITYTGILAFIDPDQMRWLEEDLGEHGDMPTMIFLHHPPIASIEQGIDSQLILAPQMEYIVRNYPSIVGIFAGHTHINRYNEIDGIPCVETASLIQYPCGYNVYKVYTHGYIQSFYKVHRLDISERSRDYCNSVPILTREPSEYMGALEDRDFVYTW